MEPLPFVDAHAFRIAAPAPAVWSALQATVRRAFSRRLPRPLVQAWGLSDGDPFLGFHVTTAEEPRLWALEGNHRFASYELRFELVPDGASTVVRASTFASFPGVRGAIYRGLVIGSGGHRFVVRRMLRQVARRLSAR